jgi:hypothetical protein
MRRILLLLLALPAVMSVVVLALYLYKFGSLSDPTLSSEMSEWGQFGDYVGGALGTYFAFLAFIAVLGTVWLQHQQLELQNTQLEHARTQASIDELQRLMSYSAERIDAVLYSDVEVPQSVGANDPVIAFEKPTMFVHSMLSVCARWEQEPRDPLQEVALDDSRAAIAADASLVVIRLQHLVRALRVYRERGGSADIEALYRERYEVEVYWLDVLGLLSSKRVKEYFDPDRLAATMRPESAEESAT